MPRKPRVNREIVGLSVDTSKCLGSGGMAVIYSGKA